ncbi:MAG: DUF1847 domain-containing protein [Desulfobacterota bacterium]|nr:DUF1847 domain-containing protein [Thermodesulfobacteriota bacterium]MDW8001130.1 DUF1847 domain-containing protein [Deltaproteobacteria bacterium]
MGKASPHCAECDLKKEEKICLSPNGKSFPGCPTLKKEIVEDSKKEYEKPDILKFAQKASIQEAECYANRERRPYVMHPYKTRIEEIYEFAKKMGYRKLGLVFCIGLKREAEIANMVFKTQGFDVISVICKAGRIAKEELGLKDEEKIFIGEFESACNPILQAFIVNREKTDFNVLLGLCVGHDSLFFKYAEAPTTVLAVKDRVTGHNPLAALYTCETYYARLLKTDS